MVKEVPRVVGKLHQESFPGRVQPAIRIPALHRQPGPGCVGRLITVQGREIAINALQDADEADKILEWLKREINQAWDNRATITPSTEGAPKPKLLEILKLLPRTNCRQCGELTCMVFAARAAEGVKSASDCAPLTTEAKQRLDDYLGGFNFDA
jgi:ArsR family metal-binding transcriptional regulator